MNLVSAPATTVYIVDDDMATRKSLRWLVETLNVPVKTFHAADSFLQAYEPSQPGCLVLDMMMPGMNGLDLLLELRARGCEIPIIVLTGYADVPSTVAAFEKGRVFKFLEKPLNDDILLERIQEALALDLHNRRELILQGKVLGRLDMLTPREREVLDLVIEGLSSKQIAAQLHVSSKTVEAHRAKIMKKMQAESVAQLVGMVVAIKPSAGARSDNSVRRRTHVQL